MKKLPPDGWVVRALMACALAALAGCMGMSGAGSGGPPPPGNPAFRQVEKSADVTLFSKEELALLEESSNPVYRIGSGDVLRLEVFGRPEVSGKHVVGPDGRITVPIVGDVVVGDLSREAAQQALAARLRVYFTQPHLTLSVEEYASNQVTVLGRVERAGMQKFPHPPTLAEVLAGAGAMPILDKQATLTRCAIMRGRDKLIWVDLKALLNGDPNYNLRMKKGDIVFIPDSSETAVYVLGAVTKPGIYRLTSRLTVLDAIAQAGGPTENAAPSKIGIYRAGSRQVEIIDFAELIDVQRRVNYALEDGDVIFVPESGMARFGYIMRQVAPGLGVLTFGLTTYSLVK